MPTTQSTINIPMEHATLNYIIQHETRRYIDSLDLDNPPTPEKIEIEFARKITAPLVGTYELRLADAHLPSSKISEAYNLIGIDDTQSYIHQAHHMLHQCVTSIYTIINVIQKWDTLKKEEE